MASARTNWNGRRWRCRKLALLIVATCAACAGRTPAPAQDLEQGLVWARRQIEIGKAELALDSTRAWAASHPEHRDAQLVWSEVLEAVGWYRAAKQALVPWLASAGASDAALLDRVVVLCRRLGDEREALQHLQLWVGAQGDDSGWRHYEMGELAFHVQDFGLAVTEFTAARAARPDAWQCAAAESSARLARDAHGDLEAARELLDQAIAQNPQLAELYFQRAVARERADDPVGARTDYEQAIAHNAGDTRAMCSLGRLLDTAGEIAPAIEWLERARAALPEPGQAPPLDNTRAQIDQRLEKLRAKTRPATQTPTTEPPNDPG